MVRGQITVEDRVENLEKSHQKHSESISEIALLVGKHDDHIEDIGRWRTIQTEALVHQRRDISLLAEAQQARKEAQIREDALNEAAKKALDLRLSGIEASIKSVYSLGKWLLATAGGVLVLAIVRFLVQGGFAVVP